MTAAHQPIARGDVNEVTGKGRHTTTAAVLYRPEPGLELIDTPGVREFGLFNVPPREVTRREPVGGVSRGPG